MSHQENASSKTYHVSKGDESLGPWTIEEVSQRLASGELALTDFAYEESAEDWVSLLEFSPLKAHLSQSSGQKAKPKKAPPKKELSTNQIVAIASSSVVTKEVLTHSFNSESSEGSAEWFVQKGPQRYGPFTYLGVIRALQEKTIYEFDLIKKNGQEEWTRIAEVAEFSPEAVRALSASVKTAQGVFLPRRFPRVSFDREVLVHDNNQVWIGRAYEGSAGGSGLFIENATLTPGQILQMHFSADGDLAAFNAICEIVSKRFDADLKDTDEAVAYAVRFLKIESQAENRVKNYFLKTRAVS